MKAPTRKTTVKQHAPHFAQTMSLPMVNVKCITLFSGVSGLFWAYSALKAIGGIVGTNVKPQCKRTSDHVRARQSSATRNLRGQPQPQACNYTKVRAQRFGWDDARYAFGCKGKGCEDVERNDRLQRGDKNSRIADEKGMQSTTVR